MPVFVIHKMQANIYSEKERSKVECVLFLRVQLQLNNVWFARSGGRI